jgi:hypothetical protein
MKFCEKAENSYFREELIPSDPRAAESDIFVEIVLCKVLNRESESILKLRWAAGPDSRGFLRVPEFPRVNRGLNVPEAAGLVSMHAARTLLL